MELDKNEMIKAVDGGMVQVVETSRMGLVKQAADLEVKTANDSDMAVLVLKRLNIGIKAIEEKRKAFVQPLNDHVKDINAFFKEIRQPLEDEKSALNKRNMAYRAEQQRLHLEEVAKAEAEQRRREKISLAKGGDGIAKTPVAEIVPVHQLRDTTQVRKVWKAEVIDFKALPDEYKIVNTVMLNEAIRRADRNDKNEPQIQINGVRVFCQEIPIN